MTPVSSPYGITMHALTADSVGTLTMSLRLGASQSEAVEFAHRGCRLCESGLDHTAGDNQQRLAGTAKIGSGTRRPGGALRAHALSVGALLARRPHVRTGRRDV